MTTLHFVFDVNLELFDPTTRRTLDKVRLPLTGDNFAPNSRARGIDTTTLPYIQQVVRNKFEQGDYNWVHDILTYSFDHFMNGYFDPYTWKYHMWVRNNGPVNPQYLANALSSIDPERGGVDGWMGGEISAIGETEAMNYGWAGIDLVPTVDKVNVISETEVAVNQLPPSEY